MAPSSDDLYDRFMKADLLQVGHLIELHRSACGLSIEALARRAGMAPLDVSKLETGRARGKPSAERLRLIADVLAGCDSEEPAGKPAIRHRTRHWFGDASIVSVVLAILTIISILSGLAGNVRGWLTDDAPTAPTATAQAAAVPTITGVVPLTMVTQTPSPMATATAVVATPTVRPSATATPVWTATTTATRSATANAASPGAATPTASETLLSVTIQGANGQSIGRIVAAPVGSNEGWSRIRISLSATGGDPARFGFALADQGCQADLTEVWQFERSELTQEVHYSLSALKDLAIRFLGPGPSEERCVRLDGDS